MSRDHEKTTLLFIFISSFIFRNCFFLSRFSGTSVMTIFLLLLFFFPLLFSASLIWHVSFLLSRTIHDLPWFSKLSCERHTFIFIRRVGEKGKARKCGPINCNCRVDSTNLFFLFFFFFHFFVFLFSSSPNNYVNFSNYRRRNYVVLHPTNSYESTSTMFFLRNIRSVPLAIIDCHRFFISFFFFFFFFLFLDAFRFSFYAC